MPSPEPEHTRTSAVARSAIPLISLALLIADAHFPELNREKVMLLALLHDLGEVHAGDLTPADGVTRDEKHRLEAASVQQVLGDLEGGGAYVAVWQEYEDGATPEARLVREVDRLEMGLQAAVYERQSGRNLSEFYASAEEALSSPVLVTLLEAFKDARRV